MGLLVAGLTGFFTGLLGLGLGLSWKAALVLLGGSVAKDVLLFLNQHPVDSIQEDSTNHTGNPS